MTDTTSYNDRAIETAQRLMAMRRAKAVDRSEVPLDRLLARHDKAALGVRLEWGRMGERPVSEALERRATELGIEFEHLGLTLGSILHGADLREPTPELFAFVRTALLERKVVFFRDQHLDEAQQVAFGRGFGELDAFPFGRPGSDPYILQIVHGPGSPGFENGWHTDVTWMEEPSLGSIAQLVEGPALGGDTLFSDSHAALLGLPAHLRDRVPGLHGVNDYGIFVGGGHGEDVYDAEIVEQVKAAIPFGVTHPIVRTHPETGKQALYLHGGFLRHDSLHDPVTGEHLEPAESRRLVRELLAQHARPEYQCRFRWEIGSVAFWDNRAVQHYAASDYYPHERVLRRVTVRGDRPVYRSDAD